MPTCLPSRCSSGSASSCSSGSLGAHRRARRHPGCVLAPSTPIRTHRSGRAQAKQIEIGLARRYSSASSRLRSPRASVAGLQPSFAQALKGRVRHGTARPDPSRRSRQESWPLRRHGELRGIRLSTKGTRRGHRVAQSTGEGHRESLKGERIVERPCQLDQLVCLGIDQVADDGTLGAVGKAQSLDTSDMAARRNRAILGSCGLTAGGSHQVLADAALVHSSPPRWAFQATSVAAPRAACGIR